MDRACSMHGGRGIRVGFWWESQKEKDHYKALEIGGRIMLQEVQGRTDLIISFDTTRTT
jgi:hypothetical protein